MRRLPADGGAAVHGHRSRRATYRFGWPVGCGPYSLLVDDGGQLALQGAGRELPHLPRIDDSVAIDEEGLRRTENAIRTRNALVRIHRRLPCRAVAHHEITSRGGSVLEDHADHHQAVVGMALRGLLQERKLLDAWRAPACPEVEHHRTTAQLGKADGVAIQIGKS